MLSYNYKSINVSLVACRTCCALVDLVASGLILVLNMIRNTYKLDGTKTSEQEDQLETQSIQELYRKVHANDTKCHRGQRRVSKINIDDNDCTVPTPKRSVIIFYI